MNISSHDSLTTFHEMHVWKLMTAP